MRITSARSTAFLLLIGVLLAGCGEAAQPDETALASAPSVTTEARDSLPADLDFGGETIAITIGDYTDAWWEDMYSDEETGNRCGV